jgi:hypothetical protein
LVLLLLLLSSSPGSILLARLLHRRSYPGSMAAAWSTVVASLPRPPARAPQLHASASSSVLPTSTDAGNLVRLGQSPVQVSPIGIGAWSWGDRLFWNDSWDGHCRTPHPTPPLLPLSLCIAPASRLAFFPVTTCGVHSPCRCFCHRQKDQGLQGRLQCGHGQRPHLLRHRRYCASPARHCSLFFVLGTTISFQAVKLWHSLNSNHLSHCGPNPDKPVILCCCCCCCRGLWESAGSHP